MPGQSLADAPPVTAFVFGKMPAHGDFVARGLDDEWVAKGDAAVAEAMALAAHRWDMEWDEVYVETPVWRFIAGPGLFAPQWTAGVFLASIDAVGRQFPLVAGFASPSLALLARPAVTDAALDEAESLARAALLDVVPVDRTIESLDAAAERLFDAVSAGGPGAAFAARLLHRLESAPWEIEAQWWVVGGEDFAMSGALTGEGLMPLFRRAPPPPVDTGAAPPVDEAPAADPAPADAASPEDAPPADVAPDEAPQDKPPPDMVSSPPDGGAEKETQA